MSRSRGVAGAPPAVPPSVQVDRRRPPPSLAPWHAARLRLTRAAAGGRARRLRPAALSPPPRGARRTAGRQAGARGEGRGAARAAHGRRPARAPPARPVRGADGRAARPGRDGDGRRRGALHHLARGAPARDAAARGGGRRRRERADEGDVLQPAVARAQVPAGHAADAPRQVRGAEPLPRPVRTRRRRGRRGRPARWRPTPRRRGSRPPRSPRSCGSTATRWPTSWSRCPRACAWAASSRTGRRRSHAAHFGDHDGGRRRLAFEELLLLQLALLRRRARRRDEQYVVYVFRQENVTYC